MTSGRASLHAPLLLQVGARRRTPAPGALPLLYLALALESDARVEHVAAVLIRLLLWASTGNLLISYTSIWDIWRQVGVGIDSLLRCYR